MIIRKIIIVCSVWIHIFSSISLADDTAEIRTSYFDERWMKAVVSIEVIQKSGNAEPIGTGFLVESPNKHILLVTAKHVVIDNEGNIIKNLAVRLNDKSGTSILLTDESFEKLTGGKWFLSKTSDLACQYIYKKKNSEALSIPLSAFLTSSELNVGAPLIILGFPMGLRSDEFAVPIARKAMVARSDSGTVIVDGLVFPGNSGGPVIYTPTIKMGKSLQSGVLNEQRIVGVVSQAINFVDVAISQQTKRPRITFEDNSGLSEAIPADEILKLINREDVQMLDKDFN